MFRFGQGSKTQVKLLALCVRNVSMSTQCGAETGNNCDNRSIHSDGVEEVHNVPLNVIIRPIPPVLDELKVQSVMDAIKVTLLCNNVREHWWEVPLHLLKYCR